MKKEKIEKRVASEQQCMKRVTNSDLVCKDCKFVYDDTIRLGNTSMCERFDVKPTGVLLGDDCTEYEKEE